MRSLQPEIGKSGTRPGVLRARLEAHDRTVAGTPTHLLPRATKVVMLASNPCVNDSRIIRSAEAVATLGCEVTVLAPRLKAPAEEYRNGVRYLRLDLPASRVKRKPLRAFLAHMASRVTRVALPLKKSLKRLPAKASTALWKLLSWLMWASKCVLLLPAFLIARGVAWLWKNFYRPELIAQNYRQWSRGPMGTAVRNSIWRLAGVCLHVYRMSASVLEPKLKNLESRACTWAALLISKAKSLKQRMQAFLRRITGVAMRLVRSYLRSFGAVAKRLALSLRQGRAAMRSKLVPIFNSTFHTHLQAHRHIALFSNTLADLHPDIVHAHDLATLPAAIEAMKHTSGRVIYDAHELETHRNIKTGAIDRWNCRRIEGKYIRKAAGVVTVCDSIADYLASTYMIARPHVVMNAPEISNSAPPTSSSDLRSDLQLSAISPLAVYVGRITIGRGIEQTVEALAHWPDLHLALLGTAHRPVLEAATEIAVDIGAEDRLHYLQPVPPAQVVAYVATADISVMAIQNICLSYYFCLPNKLMESVLAGLPVVASDFPELRRFVELSGGGVLMDETDPADIARAMREAYRTRHDLKLDDRRRQLTMQNYGWETQRARLLALYAELTSVTACKSLMPEGGELTAQPSA